MNELKSILLILFLTPCILCEKETLVAVDLTNVSISTKEVWDDVCGHNPSRFLVKRVLTELSCMARKTSRLRVSHFLDSCFINEGNMRIPQSPESWLLFYCKSNDSWVTKNIIEYCFLYKGVHSKKLRMTDFEELFKCFEWSHVPTNSDHYFEEFEYLASLQERDCNEDDMNQLLEEYKNSGKSSVHLDECEIVHNHTAWKEKGCRSDKENTVYFKRELEMIRCWDELFIEKDVSSCWQTFSSHPIPNDDEDWKNFFCHTENHVSLLDAVRYCSAILRSFSYPFEDYDENTCIQREWVIPRKELNLLETKLYRIAREKIASLDFCVDHVPSGRDRVFQVPKSVEKDNISDEKVKEFKCLVKRLEGSKRLFSAIEFCWRTLTIVGDPENVPRNDKDWSLVVCNGRNLTESDVKDVITCIKDILTPESPTSFPSDAKSTINLDGC